MHKSLSLFLRSLLFFLPIAATVPAMAQNYAQHNWYFGNSTNGIRFNRTDNTASLTPKVSPFGLGLRGGSAVATNAVNGDLLFYTDGVNIYTADNQLMAGSNGPDLNGDAASNQPVVICKVPGSKTRYYIFTRTAAGGISYTIVDMSLGGTYPNPPTGEVLITDPVAPFGKNVAIPALTAQSESMMVVTHENGEDFWLITHGTVAGTPAYFVTPITGPGGIGVTTAYGAGLILQARNFSYRFIPPVPPITAPQKIHIAVTPAENLRNIEIIEFDITNGGIVPILEIPNTDQDVYDTEWSNSGQYLYVSRLGEPGIPAEILQYDIEATISSPVGSPTPTPVPMPAAIAVSYGLQMAPDSAIYHLYQATAGGPFLLGALTDTDTIASEIEYDASAFASTPDFDGRQFPSFAPKDTVGMTVTFTYEGTCADAPTAFFPTVVPAADSLVWSFGQPPPPPPAPPIGDVNAWSPVYTYSEDGTFPVTVTAYLNGQTATYTDNITIRPFDLQLTLVQDTTACVCELPINNGKPTATPGVSCPNDTSDDLTVTVQAQGGSPSYQWFGPSGLLVGQTSATLRPDSAGYYYVVASLDPPGTPGACVAYAGVNIKEYDSLDQRANIWYFGQTAGIDFNGLPEKPPVAITGPLVTPEGTAVVSDRNGQVIFSTDGNKIYDKDDNEIPLPAPGLGGENSSTQSALIIPVTGDETLFYIFTTQQVDDVAPYQLRYSLFDLKLNNGVGGLRQYNQMLFERSTERITGNDNWLIAHEYGNNAFRAYRITAQGISSPIISAIGSDHNFTVPPTEGQGYMELGGQNRLAVALSTPGISNVVEVFDFVDSTGMVTNFRTANLQSPSGQVYGLEISPAGNKLFATLRNGSAQLYEFAFDTLGIPHLKQQVNHSEELGAMQIGPDGQIYVAMNGRSNLGTFSANEDTTQLSAITTLQSFALAGGTTSNLGLPNFTQIISNPTQAPNASFTGTCWGDSTQFTASGKDSAIDKFDWFFGDGNAVTDGGPQVNHLYADSGTYIVNVRIYNKCEEVRTIPMTVVIRGVPADPSTAVALCTGSTSFDANPLDRSNYTYAWQNGETTETITVNTPGVYRVTITDPRGCSTDAQFLASDNRPLLDFGPDLDICQNAAVAPLNAENPGTNYVWTLNGGPTGNTAQLQPVDTSVPGTFEYEVVVTDPITTCTATENIIYTINESPAFAPGSPTPFAPSACGLSDGHIDLTIASPVGSLFSYDVVGNSGPFSGVDQAAGALISTPSTMSAGTYSVTITDQVSGCPTTTTVSLNDATFTVSGTQSGTCDPLIDIDVTSTAVGAVNYRVFNNATGLVVPPGVTPAAGNFHTMPVPSGSSYVVEVTDGSGCIQSSAPVAIVSGTQLAVTFNTAGLCNTPPTITASATGAASFDWTASPPGSVTPTTGNGTVTVSVGTWNLQVTIDDGPAGDCPGIGILPVTVNPPTTADFTQTDACADQVTLTATANPAGSYTYRWYRGTTPPLALTPGGGARVITANTGDNGFLYRVDVVNSRSGCVFPSAEKAVNVLGDLSVDLAVPATPCDGSPFTLNATTTPATGPGLTWTFEVNSQKTPIAGQTSASLTDTRAGIYEVTATMLGCTATDNLSIVPAPVTAGRMTDTGIICPDPANPDVSTREIVLDPGPDFVSYTWYREQTPLGVTTQTYTALDAGLYSVDLINSFGCASSDRTTLMEQCDPRITGPNAFRPTSGVNQGGEFTNRDFKLFTFFIADTDFQVFIFNRWGEMVYQTNERNFRWNGGYNNNLGQPLPPGTYSYLVRYKSSYREAEGIQEKRGGVVLVR